MAAHSITVPSADAHGHTARIEVSGGHTGGWNVTATLDGRVVTNRHRDDWHRAERARAALTTELRECARDGWSRSALVAMLVIGSPASPTRRPPRRAVRSRHRPDGHLRRTAHPGARDRLPHAHAWRWQRSEERLLSRVVEHADRCRLDYRRPGYRCWFSGDQMFIDGSAAVSWRAYKMAQARIELPRLAKSRLALGTQVRWQDLTQVA